MRLTEDTFSYKMSEVMESDEDELLEDLDLDLNLDDEDEDEDDWEDNEDEEEDKD